MFRLNLKKKSIIFLAMMISFMFFLVSCSNDLLGLFYSTGIKERFAMKDSFVYLDESDRQLSLNEELSFLVLTDIHIADNNVYGMDQLAKVIAENGDSFVAITGDITQSGTPQELELFLKTADAFGVPCYPVIGNHDIYFGNWNTWEKMIGSTTYRIDAGEKTTLLMLDSANASFGKDQLDWLETQLGTAGEHTFVFTHANLFTSGGGEFQQLTDIRERFRIMSLLEGKCTAFFSGHSHEQVIKQAGKVQYITLKDFKTKGTYCRVRVSSEGVSYEFNSL
ncbi:MAG: metallophosphoesterase [Treponema sp.]|jgi:3',5'-cyclic AMP phosphodiesterase CpdA|nr:metallophosphoesterase [Treponema sp.]